MLPKLACSRVEKLLYAFFEGRGFAAQMGENARRRIELLGDPRRHLEGLLAIYREAMSA